MFIPRPLLILGEHTIIRCFIPRPLLILGEHTIIRCFIPRPLLILGEHIIIRCFIPRPLLVAGEQLCCGYCRRLALRRYSRVKNRVCSNRTSIMTLQYKLKTQRKESYDEM